MSDVLADATPNCPECLHRLDVAGRPENPFWWCGRCRVAVMVAAVTAVRQ